MSLNERARSTCARAPFARTDDTTVEEPSALRNWAAISTEVGPSERVSTTADNVGTPTDVRTTSYNLPLCTKKSRYDVIGASVVEVPPTVVVGWNERSRIPAGTSPELNT